MNVLGIETSCDETAAAVVRDGREILSDIVASQVDIHARFGGVVPEIASRKHVELINPVIREALDSAGIRFQDVNAVAVTNRPGLLGALLIGVSAAKPISAVLGVPLVGIHHLEGHIYANFLVNPNLAFPFICLIVSGGHSDLVLVRGHGDYEILGRTRDDAAGEAFDKSARVLGLGYPGGPIINELADKGNPKAIRFPRANLGDTLDFSFAGLKTALLRFFREKGAQFSIQDIAASFQAAVVDMLVNTTMAAVERTGISRVALAGGVAANTGLQRQMRDEAAQRGIELSCPPPQLCTDNAAMIACAGYYHTLRGDIDALDLDTIASQPLARSTGST
ncbi:MAG TPA: tRNA (adenosine(37)-N6)-threonylcarbamoyltransferase complex transferase subunit TsaD [Armatimonadota bacterium]|nr:tRNA (adenosine(37)-N6)-threonylcarbamoyltransferase complex transferase subunit TsaD [Armatimonadota bacterium]